MTVYFDANAIIYYFEGSPELRAQVTGFLARVTRIRVSTLAMTEVLVKPIADGDPALLGNYRGWFELSSLEIIEVTRDIAERAAELRALHGLKTPDAIHAATALLTGCEALPTTPSSAASPVSPCCPCAICLPNPNRQP